MNASIDWRRLQHFLLLVEEMNFSRAGQRANLSQTAFSRSIQALEAELGLRLFDRGTRVVQVTAAGRQLAERARDLMARAADLRREAQHMATGEAGELHFGASLLAIDTVMPGVLPQLIQARPGLRLRTEVGQWEMLRDELLHERIEFFVAHPGDLAQDPRFHVTLLKTQAASIFCRAGHPLLAHKRALPLQALLDFPWATLQLSKSLTKFLQTRFGLESPDQLPFSFICENLGLLREAVLQTDALLWTWRHWLQADLHSGAVVDIGQGVRKHIAAERWQLELAVVKLSGRSASPAAQALIQLLARP